jgi:DNA repair protein RadA
MLTERQQKLFRFMHGLKTIAQNHNLAVIVTNQINTKPDSQRINPHGPVGGNTVSHTVTYGVSLSTNNQLIHYATIVKSPYHPSNSTTFRIGAKGLEDMYVD